MAFTFGASDVNRLTLAASVRPAADPRPITVGWRIKQNSINDRGGVSQWIFENVYGAGNPNFAIGMTGGATTNTIVFFTNSGFRPSAAFTNDTAWHSYTASFGAGSPGALSFHRDGVDITDGAANTAFFAGANTVAFATIGGYMLANAGAGQANDANYADPGAFNIDGALGEFAVWGVVLEPAAAVSFTLGAAAPLVRPDSLVCWMPFGVSVTQDLRLGAVWVQQGTNAVAADHPRIFYAGGPMSVPAKAIVSKTYSWMRRGLRQQHLLVR